MDVTAKRYHDEANHCRKLAETLSALPKEHMLDLARQYEELAEKAEKHGEALRQFVDGSTAERR